MLENEDLGDGGKGGKMNPELAKKVNDALGDKKVKNPESGREIKVTSALKKDHPAYKQAKSIWDKTFQDVIEKDKKEKESKKEPEKEHSDKDMEEIFTMHDDYGDMMDDLGSKPIPDKHKDMVSNKLRKIAGRIFKYDDYSDEDDKIIQKMEKVLKDNNMDTSILEF